MSLLEGLKIEISNNVSGLSNKVFPVVAPEGTILPYAVYQRISTEGVEVLEGYTDSEYLTVQISFFASTFSQMITMQEQFKQEFKNFSGTLGTVNVQYVEFINEFELEENITPIRHKGITECRFYYNE